VDSVDKYRGDDWSIPVTVKQETGGMVTAYDVTGATLTSSIGGTPGWSGTPSIVDGPTGAILITVPKATTATFAPGQYYADVQVDKGGTRQTAVKFLINVLEDVTVP